MVKTNFKPLNGCVILDWAKDAEVTTESGIIVGESNKRSDIAVIIAVPTKSDFIVGQKVIFNKMAGQFVTDSLNQQVLIIKDEDVWGIVE